MKKSIKHLPKRTQEELTVLLDLVCKSVDNCQMIILFGSYARGNYVLWDTKIEFGVRTSYQSDYDILVITNGAVKRAERKLERITNKYHDLFEYRRHAFPQFIVEHINTVNNNLEVSQYFFTDIVKEGILLYDSGKYQLAKPRKLSFREIRDIAQNEFSELYPYACGFLDLVKLSLHNDQRNKIFAFLLHQACTNGKTNCSIFKKHFVPGLPLLTQNKMCILLQKNRGNLFSCLYFRSEPSKKINGWVKCWILPIL